jgi:hypothetical protein
MKNTLLVFLFLIPATLFSQKNLYLGWNIPPVLVGTIDLRIEQQLGRNIAFQGGLGFRTQGRDTNETAFISALNRYSAVKNRALYFSAGIRAFERSPAEYPYLAFDIVGVYYDERVLTQNLELRDVNGFKIGGALTLGFVSRITKRLSLDVALRLGYSPPRPSTDVFNYYLPGLGYNTAGFNVLSVPGGHIDPILTLKYNLIKSRRDKIKEKD